MNDRGSENTVTRIPTLEASHEQEQDPLQAIIELAHGKDTLLHKKTAIQGIDDLYPDGSSNRQKEALIGAVDIAQQQGDVRRLGMLLSRSSGFDKERTLNFSGALAQKVSWWAEQSEPSIDRLGEELDRFISRQLGEKRYKELLEQDPLLRPFLLSKISGSTFELQQAVWQRTTELVTSEKWGSENSSVRLHANRGMVELRLSMAQVYGNDSLVMQYMHNQTKTTDTPFSFYIPTTQQEMRDLQRNFLDTPTWLAAVLQHSYGTIGMGHGFGGTRDVWLDAAAEWLKPTVDEQPLRQKNSGLVAARRCIGVSLSTKGAEGTALKRGNEVLSGSMDRGALQIAETLFGLGLVGNDQPRSLVWIGHSMGGQEALWLPMYCHRKWKLFTIPVTPVVTNDPDFLLLYRGITGVLLKMPAQPKPIGPVAAYAGSELGLINAVVEYRNNTGGVRPEDMEAINRIHGETPFDYDYMRGEARGLELEDPLRNGWLGRLNRMYGDTYLGVVVAKDDNILEPKRMEAELDANGLAGKKKVVRGPHYIFAKREGRKAIGYLAHRQLLHHGK